MGKYQPVADEFIQADPSSRSFCEKPFENDDLETIVEAQEDPQIPLEYSIEVGLHDPNLQQNEVSDWRRKIINIARRHRIIVGVAIFFALVLIVSLSTTASRKANQLSANEFRKSGYSSRYPGGRDKLKLGRGQGGGAGNAANIFTQTQNSNLFISDDVEIPAFSTLDPVQDLDRYSYDRPIVSAPSARLNPLIDQTVRALPTNAWYQNMLRLDVNEDPTKNHRVYTMPYVIDAAGDFAGIRAHATRLDSTPQQVRLAIDEPYGLTLGAMADINSNSAFAVLDKGYSVHEATELGLTLQWSSYMKTTLVRGMPYITMAYDTSDQALSEGILPTMHWSLDTSELPIVDGNRRVDCLSESTFTVERDLELSFHNSNQSWMIFFSRPVKLQCQNRPGSPTIFQVLEEDTNNEDSILIVRGALIVSSINSADNDEFFRSNYINQLIRSANIYPGQLSTVTHSFNEQSDAARISFDWDAQSMSTSRQENIDQPISRSANEMIMFALPHHREIIVGKVSSTLCTTSLLGPICLVEGNTWNMYESLPVVDFRAARHPDPKYIPILADALINDISYKIPSNFQSGASDTYFSGKTIAKLARILLITEEVKDLCSSVSLNGPNREYINVCNDLELPNEEEIGEALNQLREAVTVWVRTNTKAPFVYDNAWGGLVNCGCLYNNGECTNNYPNCPAFIDQGLNFGNGFFNDHHFHYGYHVYAAAALAHFDSAWAIDHFEDITLLVRDYANPSNEDTAFPIFRNKDWYRGHSWASGITNPMFENIMNQESSSEAIMAYEAVALFGKTMTSIFQKRGDTKNAFVTNMMHKIGLTLTATEIRSTQKYWQVRQNVKDSEKIYPEIYDARVVGILWETFAQFTTWFGNAPYLIYGIQLLPITPIAEARDSVEWAEEIYEPLAASCNGACVREGWSVQVAAILATIGRVQEAVDAILSVPSTAYEFAGGNGHSKSNALWYITTRHAPESSFQNDEEFETSSIDENEDETISDEENSESIVETDDSGEDTENISVDEQGQDSTGLDDEESEMIEPEIDIGELFIEYDDKVNFFDGILDKDEFPDENEDNEEESISNDVNGSNEMIAENEGSEGSYNSGNDENIGAAIDVDDSISDDEESAVSGLACFNPTDCTDEVLNTVAEGYSCRDRIKYLMQVLGKPEFYACRQVAVDEYPTQCGSCRPSP